MTEAEAIVDQLNSEIFEAVGESDLGFEYSSTGFVQAISFNGYTLWCSEDDYREIIDDEKEDLETFIRRSFYEYADNCAKITEYMKQPK